MPCLFPNAGAPVCVMAVCLIFRRLRSHALSAPLMDNRPALPRILIPCCFFPGSRGRLPFVSSTAATAASCPPILSRRVPCLPARGVPVSLNAALAASGASWLYIRGGFVTTKAVAAPGICASGVGTRLLVNGSAIHTWEDASPGMVIGEDAQAFTSQLSISTQGEGSPAMQVEGAGSLWRGWYTQATTAAPSSPALLCRDSSVFLYAARLEAWQSPALVVETGAKVTLLQAQLSGNSPAALYLRSPWNAGAPPVPVRIQLTGSQLRPSRQSPAILVFHTQADIVLQQSSLEGDIYVGPQGSAQVTLGSGSLWRGQFQGPGKGTLQQRQGGRWVRPAVSSE